MSDDTTSAQYASRYQGSAQQRGAVVRSEELEAAFNQVTKLNDEVNAATKRADEAEKRAQVAEAQVGMLNATCQALQTTVRVLAKLLP